MKKVTKTEFINFLKKQSETFDIIAPIKGDKGIDYDIITDFDKIIFDHVNTDRSFKRFLFPQSQTLFEFKEGVITEAKKQNKKKFIVGIRNCDINSLKVFDYNFIEKEPVDTFYKELRDNTILITAACPASNSTCFCTSFKIDPLSIGHGDIGILFDKEEDSFYIQGNSSAGKDIVDGLSTKDTSDFDQKKEKYKKNHEKNRDLIKDKNLVEIFQSKLEDEKWGEIFKGCIGCGVCTFYCPTCYCFDIEEQGKFWNGKRVRNWDSCMFPIYSKETTGHNPRPTQKERYRNRVLHKFYYQLKHNNEYGCVGCGRCITNCPTNIDIRNIIKTFI
ncbi:MAG: 4Fe-4S dicluster domain-containing protein [bacterium]|nr:4Fe-4S dicluster domain-containing protein [bacterium]